MSGELAAAAATMTKKRKKKGRPSLLDLQKRSLKQQQQQQLLNQQKQNPNSFDRSNRRNPNSNYNVDGGDDDDDDDERQQKKHKLLLGLDNSSANYQRQQSIAAANFLGRNSAASDSDAAKRRNISTGQTGSDQLEEKVSIATDTLHGLPAESGPTTPLPDKKLLVFILDRLQKKDTYGVFSEPVDPDELPDYHEIIAHPMDFGTVRKKLNEGAYADLEQFENDIFLICSNAMQYNSPDTIYFRQARSIQELAKKDFENLRQDSDDDSDMQPPPPQPQPQPQPQQKVVRRGRPPKNLKKTLDISPSDRVASEFSSDASLANGGDNTSVSGIHNLRRAPTSSYKFRPIDTSVRAHHGSHAAETYTSGLSEWENEFPASVVRAVMKYGKKHFTVDENKRDTYNESLASPGQEQSVFSTFDGELKQLTAVGLNSEHSYARSLARFAADLGPAVWKIASKKIEKSLPNGVKYGPGFVGEDEAIDQQKSLGNYVPGDRSGSDSFVTNRYPPQVSGHMESMKASYQSDSIFVENSNIGGTKPMPSFQVHSTPVIQSDMNGCRGGNNFGFSHNPPVAGMYELSAPPPPPPNPNSNHGICSIPASDCDSSRLHHSNTLVLGSSSSSNAAAAAAATEVLGNQGNSSWQGFSAFSKQDIHSFPPPDLNVRFLAPGSPISGMQMGSPQQPDLALQL